MKLQDNESNESKSHKNTFKLFPMLIFILVLIIGPTNQINELSILSSKSWCWTKPVINDPNFILNPSIGGTNWGYCKQTTSQSQIKKEYTIYIRTSSLPNSETHGTIMISLHGSESTSKEIELTNSGFKAGAFDKIKIFSEDVGNLYSIKFIAKGRLQWRCASVRIESQMNFWDFECDQPLKWPKSMIELNVANLIEYTLNIKTSSIDESGTTLPIYISLIGTNGKSPFKLLSNKGFLIGTQVQKTIKTIDVGIIEQIALRVNGNDNWIPEEIIIRKTADTDSEGKTTKKEQIFKNYKGEPVIGLTPLKLMIEGKENEEEASNLHDTILDQNDQNNLIKLSCNDILKGNENFGPVYSNNNNFVNYENFLAECPSDCLLKPSSQYTYGLAFHPEESPICLSAIVDRAVSFYGGIISISVYKGLDSYTGGMKIFNIPVSSHAKSKRSYAIGKVDNIDMIEKDVRILDNDGKHSNRGRVEIRYNGIWGTVCAVGLGESSANVICKQLGYKSGKFLNPTENTKNAKNFCRNYKGLNYCGVEVSQVLFSSLNCKGNEENIIECNREAVVSSSDLCSNNNHQYDTLIECDNIEEEINFSFKTNTIRLIDKDGNPSQNGIGRLEILRSSWGTVCDNHNVFNSKAASIACKEMGYIDGTLFDNTNNNCNNVLGSNLCGELTQPIKISNVRCKGTEKSIKDCKNNDITLDCNHNNDVILKCTGLGDSSGKSQNEVKPKVITPLIQKLPLQPIYSAKCDTTPRDIYFRGDPGSVYIVNCPNYCDKTTYSVFGTGIYTLDSSICRSAIQSGVITQEGGDVALVKAYGQNKYYGNLMRNIISLEDNGGNVSFFVTSVNSGYYYLVELFSSSYIGANNRYSSFIELSTHKKATSASSFISISQMKEAKAIFEWTPTSNSFIFDNSFVDLTQTENYQKLFELSLFTIYSKIQMKANDLLDDNANASKQTIFSIGGCEGFSITISTESEILFDVKCSKEIHQSGIYVPVNSFITFAIVYDGLRLDFYLNNKKTFETSITFNPHYTRKNKITLGKSSEYDTDFFNGQIKFLAVFNEALDSKRIFKIYTNGYTHPDKVSALKSFTLDDRICISTCYNLPIPGHMGSPTPPTEAITYEINGDKNYLPNSNGESTNIVLDPFVEIKCSTTARELFKGEIKVGDKLRVKCPDDCSLESLTSSVKGGVFGTLIYSFDSLVCYSAVHSGILSSDSSVESMLIVNTLPGMTFYQGTNQYKIQSTSIDKSDYSFSVEVAPSIIQIDCKTTSANDSFSNTLGMKFLVRCPEKCSKIPHRVYGNGIYSGDSSICQAAIHSGALNDRGGEVKFEITQGKKIYFGSKAFGIESKERDSYVKSIQFFSSKNNLYTKYIEKCDDKSLDSNWDIIDDLKAYYYPSKWECVDNPTISANYNEKNLQRNYVIKQSKTIKSTSPMNYGSILSLKNTDIVNSIFKISFYFNNLSPVGVIFRYKDENNFYHLRINNSGTNKIVLVKKYEGKSYILSTSTISITPRIWYTFTLKIYYEKFFVFLQIGELRNNQQIMSVEDNDIQRGGLGIATDGNDNFYINGIYIDNYNIANDRGKSPMAEKENKYSFEKILKYNTPNTRDKYCKSLIEKTDIDVKECKEFHYYCSLRCNEMVHRRENILNYNCYKSCVWDTINREKVQNLIASQQVSYGISKEVWSPKEKDKCDYKPDDYGELATWVKCYVLKVTDNERDPEQKTIEIKYKVGGVIKSGQIIYPNVNFKKCGTMMKDRTDCSKKEDDLEFDYKTNTTETNNNNFVL